jgi:hypothetical protein
MAEVEKNSLQQLIDWIFSWKEPFEWLRQRIGLLLTVVVILSAVAVVAAVYTMLIGMIDKRLSMCYRLKHGHNLPNEPS